MEDTGNSEKLTTYDDGNTYDNVMTCSTKLAGVGLHGLCTVFETGLKRAMFKQLYVNSAYVEQLKCKSVWLSPQTCFLKYSI